MNNVIVTLARQYGCGGRTVGRLVAEMLGVKYYDNELITLAAEKNGVGKEVYENADEKPLKTFTSMFAFSSPATGYFLPVYNDIMVNDRLFLTQSSIIKDVAKEPCVIVGRCADYVLKDNPNVVKIFLHADLECRRKRILEKYKVETKDVDKFIAKADKQRAAYYNSYTDQEWGNVSNYNLTINTSGLTLEQVAKIIVDFTQTYQKNMK